MAKMFYTLEEAANKLSKSTDEVQELVETGQLQEFRDDRDRLMFKVDQVDLLAGDGGEAGDDDISLADSGLDLGASGSASAIDLEPSDASSSASSSGGAFSLEEDTEDEKESTGVNIFDVEETEEADPSAQTQMATGADATTPDFGADPASSGSGLLDLTREADDTSLGADLLEDVYAGGDGGDAGAPGDDLFESTGAESDVGATGAGAATMPMMGEVYDGPGSGWVGGVALATALVLVLGIMVAGLSLLGGGGPLMAALEDNFNFWMYVGVFAGLAVVCALIGFVIGKRG